MRAAIVVAFTGAVLLAANCGGRSAADRDGPATASPAPADGSALVLRTRTTGGIAGFGGPGSLPDFSLYRDGRAIVGARSPVEYHLTPHAFRRLVTAASDAGLATPRTVDAPGTADAMYKVITFVTGGRPRTTKIVLPGDADPAAAFLRRLDPASWPRTDLTAEPRPYRPSRIAALAVPVSGAGPAWPFAPLASGVRVGTRTCTVLTGADAVEAERLATEHSQWRDRGRTYRVTLRPLLPDETGCADLT